MLQGKIIMLFEALEDLIDDGAPWAEKASAVIEFADESATNRRLLEEFISWFDEIEDSDPYGDIDYDDEDE